MVEPEWDPYDRNCPTRRMLDRVGDRWTVLVVGALSNGPLRYSELRKRIDGVSQKMLTQTLRSLERDGLVLRTHRGRAVSAGPAEGAGGLGETAHGFGAGSP